MKRKEIRRSLRKERKIEWMPSKFACNSEWGELNLLSAWDSRKSGAFDELLTRGVYTKVDLWELLVAWFIPVTLEAWCKPNQIFNCMLYAFHTVETIVWLNSCTHFRMVLISSRNCIFSESVCNYSFAPLKKHQIYIIKITFHMEKNSSITRLDVVSITNLIFFFKNIIKKSAREKKY
jgi:hypothetical protein